MISEGTKIKILDHVDEDTINEVHGRVERFDFIDNKMVITVRLNDNRLRQLHEGIDHFVEATND